MRRTAQFQGLRLMKFEEVYAVPGITPDEVRGGLRSDPGRDPEPGKRRSWGSRSGRFGAGVVASRPMGQTGSMTAGWARYRRDGRRSMR